jgi:integrase
MSRTSEKQNPRQFFLGKYRAELFKRKDVKRPSWSVRVYLNDEKRYWVESTSCADLEEAREKAMTLVMEMAQAKSTGHTAVSPTLDKLNGNYTAHLATEKMSKHTRDNLHRRLQLCAQFLLYKKSGANLDALLAEALGHGSGPKSTLRLKDVKGTDFMDYLAWRLQTNPKLRRDTVNMELGSIKRMFVWARSRKLCGESAIPIWQFKLETKKASRARIEKDEADRVLALAKEWTQQPSRTEREAYNRTQLYFILAVMNACGARTGELLGLRNRNVKKLDANMCEVNIEEAGKTAESRPRIIPVNGTPCMLLEWIEKHQLHKQPSDYVFSRHKAGDGFAEGAFNKIHTKFKHEVLKPAKLAHMTPYHQRHHFISDALRAGVPTNDIAVYAGTSIRMISSTYSHVTGIDAGQRLLSRLAAYRG